MRYLIACGIVLHTLYSFAQTKTYTGLIIDVNRKPIPSAGIYSIPAKYVTNSDADGRFSIEVNLDTSRRLVFNSLGYEKAEIKLTNTDSSITIALQETSYALNDISVVSKKSKMHSGILGRRNLVKYINSSNSVGFEEGVFLTPKHKNSVLNRVYVYVLNGNTSEPGFRIHVYKRDSLPLLDITGGDLIFRGDKEDGWVEVDLSEKQIPIDDGVFVAIEWLEFGPMIGLTRSYGQDIFSYNRCLYKDDWRFWDGSSPMIYGTYTYSK